VLDLQHPKKETERKLIEIPLSPSLPISLLLHRHIPLPRHRHLPSSSLPTRNRRRRRNHRSVVLERSVRQPPTRLLRQPVQKHLHSFSLNDPERSLSGLGRDRFFVADGTDDSDGGVERSEIFVLLEGFAEGEETVVD